MKRVIFISWFLGLLLFSCGKDKEQGKKFFLSKVFKDALLETEYIYSSDKKPMRRNSYSTSSGQSKLNNFRLYQYSAGGLLEEITFFDANSQLSNKYTLQYDVNDRPARMNDLSKDNTIQYYYLFDYTAGHLTKYTVYTAANKKNVEVIYTNNAQGEPVKINRYSYPGVNPVLFDSTTFTFDPRPLPAHWQYFEILPFVALPNGEGIFYDMIFASTFRYFSGTPPSKTTVTYSAKTYNAAGYLTAQQISSRTEYIGPPTITNLEVTYEYIE